MRSMYRFVKAVRHSWLIAAFVGTGAASLALAGDPPTEQQMQRLLQSAAQAADRPDHDFAANSIQQLVEQANALGLKKDQIEKITAIRDQYAQTRSRREAAYKQSEMDALKLIHDRHTSLASVEAAVQKADQEHSKLRMAGIVALREAGDVLGPEQYSQWRQTHASSQVARSPKPEVTGDPSETERIAPH